MTGLGTAAPRARRSQRGGDRRRHRQAVSFSKWRSTAAPNEKSVHQAETAGEATTMRWMD